MVRQQVSSIRQRRMADTTSIRQQSIVSTRESRYDGGNQDLVQLAELTTKKRKSLKKSQFAIPKRRAYPIHDESHARNALARVSQHGTSSEKARVRAAVKRRFPGMGKSKKGGK